MTIAALWREVQALRAEEMVKEGVWFVPVGRSCCGLGSVGVELLDKGARPCP